MLEGFGFFYAASFLPVLVVIIKMLTYRNKPSATPSKPSRIGRIRSNRAFALGCVVGALALLPTFFKGNFLAPLLWVIVGPATGCVFILAAMLINTIFRLTPKPEKPVANALPISPPPAPYGLIRSFLIRFRIVLLPLFVVYLVAGLWVLKSISHERHVYGTVMDPKPLAEETIIEAYSHWFVRNDNMILRNILLYEKSPEIPVEVIEDIYKNSDDYSVLSAVVVHAKTPCGIFADFLEKRYPAGMNSWGVKHGWRAHQNKMNMDSLKHMAEDAQKKRCE
ncbi:MAG: hypothetical protein EB060_02580 [Proteobacteria bacterium]|nr:hypothetical protein [Pseudomonadota bacterium]